jgi:flagellar motor switch/type III secretory pathway protein FliN
MGETNANAAPTAAEDKWAYVQDMACDLSVELTVPGFRVRDLIQLEQQRVIDTHWPVGNDVPLRINGELLAWCEFEVIENRLAVRLTELGLS